MIMKISVPIKNILLQIFYLDLSNSVGSALDAVHIMRSASLDALVHSGSASALTGEPLSEGPLDSNATIAPVQLVTDTFASVSNVASNVAELKVRESQARCFQRRARLALFVNRDTLQVLVVQPLLEVQTNRFARIAVTPDDGADTLFFFFKKKQGSVIKVLFVTNENNTLIRICLMERRSGLESLTPHRLALEAIALLMRKMECILLRTHSTFVARQA